MSDIYGSMDPAVAGTQPNPDAAMATGGGAQSGPPAATDPAAGAGWKQGLQKVIGAVGNATRGMQFNGQGALTLPNGQQQPAQQQNAQQQQLAQRALALLRSGAISPAQFAQLTGQANPSLMQQMAPPNMAPTNAPSVNGQPPQPFTSGVAAPVYQPPASPTGPTSQAWNA